MPLFPCVRAGCCHDLPVWIALAVLVFLSLAAFVSLGPYVSLRATLSVGERRVLSQFVTILGEPIGADRTRTLSAIERYLSGLPRTARAGFRLGLWLIEQGPRLTFGSWRRFSTLDATSARRMHAHLAEHRIPTFSQLLEAIHLTVFICLGGQPEITRALQLDRTELIARKTASR